MGCNDPVATDQDAVPRIAAALAAVLPNAASLVATFGPAVSVHTGPGALGIAIYEGEVT